MASKRRVRRTEERFVCGNKAKFGSEAEARRMRDRTPNHSSHSLIVYRCRYCGGTFWHIGHAPEWVEEIIAEQKHRHKE